MKKKPPTYKTADKRAEFRRKSGKKHAQATHEINRKERMTKTHTGEVTSAGKEIARWIIERTKTTAPAPTTTDIMTRIHARHPGPKFSTLDQIAIGRTALAWMRGKDPEAWEKYRTQQPDVMDRLSFEEAST